MTEKKRGSNPSLSVIPSDAVGHAVNGVVSLLNMTKVSGLDETEVRSRLSQYLEHCQKMEVIPTVEGFALSLGIDRTTLWRWERGQGCSYEVMTEVKRAKLILQAIDAELALKQKISPVVAIFRAKNYFAMVDNVRLETEVVTERTATLEELERKYSTDDVVLVDEPKQ